MSDSLAYSTLPRFGIELDIDLSKPLSSDQQAELRQLFLTHHLIVARGQSLDEADRIRIMEYLGFGAVLHGREDAPVSNVRSGGYLGNHELSWHADLSWSSCPFKILSLYAVDVVNGASSTLFSSGTLAWQRLSLQERKRLLDLEALHVLSKAPMGRPGYDDDPTTPQALHPLILQDPHVGPIIYVHYNTTDSIVGLSRADSEALLQRLFDVIYAPQYVQEHVWNEHDFVVWNNIALQHARGSVSAAGNRTLLRMVVAEKDALDLFPAADFSKYRN